MSKPIKHVATPEEIREGINMVHQTAKELRRDAGLGGHMHDGGARKLLEKLEVFETVWDGKELELERIPSFLRSGIEKTILEKDPDWQIYQFLKEKFAKYEK